MYRSLIMLSLCYSYFAESSAIRDTGNTTLPGLVADILAPLSESDLNFEQIRFGRMAGGQEATPGQFAYQAALSHNSPDGSIVFCGGALISDKFVLTAASCLQGRDSVYLEFGGHMRHNLPPPPNRVEQTVNKTNFVLHKDFDGYDFANNIGLIKLNKPISANAYIKPIDLPRKSDTKKDFIGSKLTTSGWGLYEKGFSTSLRYVSVTGISNKICQRPHWRYIQDTNLCASGRSAICRGDVGGPLIDDCSKTLVGIASFEKTTCRRDDDVPDVYMRVTSYLDWIHNNTAIVLKP